MTIRKSVEPSWHTVDSGVVIPNGFASQVSAASSDTYLQIKEKATSLERLYADSGVTLPASCDLAGLISDAKCLSDAWFTNQIESLSIPRLIRVGHLDRIAIAVAPLRDTPACSRFLHELASGSLDLLARERSAAKNLLWELELWATLLRRSFAAELIEPPDIVIRFQDARVGVACKKLYSESNVEKVLSQAVGQIEQSFEFGIVAINLDDLMPAGKALHVPTHDALGKFVDRFNLDFLRRHERHFRKYLSAGRVIAALVSTAVTADVYLQQPRFNTGRQTTIWAIPGLPPEKHLQLRRFRSQLIDS